jgi:hypothetical protein
MPPKITPAQVAALAALASATPKNLSAANAELRKLAAAFNMPPETIAPLNFKSLAEYHDLTVAVRSHLAKAATAAKAATVPPVAGPAPRPLKRTPRELRAGLLETYKGLAPGEARQQFYAKHSTDLYLAAAEHSPRA